MSKKLRCMKCKESWSTQPSAGKYVVKGDRKTPFFVAKHPKCGGDCWVIVGKAEYAAKKGGADCDEEKPEVAPPAAAGGARRRKSKSKSKSKKSKSKSKSQSKSRKARK